MIASKQVERFFMIRIKRQDRPDTSPYWHEFELAYRPNSNVISVLQQIAAHPQTKDGSQVTPPVWECNCLEEVCGACTMVVNGRVRQACSCLIDELLDAGPTIILEPMSKFPVVRDLWVERRRMFDNLKKIEGWVPVDGTHALGAGPREAPQQQELRYAYSRCMTCGCCLEACPQFTNHNDFNGAQVFAQVDYFNLHETGKTRKSERLDAVMQAGGITDCGNSQNCVKVCPKELPLVDAIARLGRQTTIHALKQFFVGR